jgi:type IV secretion system protein TrbG
MRRRLRRLVWVALCGLCATAEAETLAPPAHAQGSGRMAAFRFDPNASYTLMCRPGAPTDVQLAPDEKVVGFALGDSVQWVVEELPGHVFVKPLRGGLSTAGTLVTDRRTYQLALRSSAGDGPWHQRVSWSYADLVVLRDAGRSGVPPRVDAAAPDGTIERRYVDPSALNFAYLVSGDPDIRPLQVFDDGRVTWLRMRPGKPLPAVFALGPDGPELVNYTVRADHIVIQRVFAAAILKLGRAEARVQQATVAGGTPDVTRPGAGARP